MRRPPVATSVPTLSISLPVYNGERYLAVLLESLRRQTFRDFELTISDNASTDGTQAICERFVARDARIRYIRHLKNSGVFANLEYAVRTGRGQYTMFVGDDDIYESTFIEEILARHRDNPALGLVYSDYSFITEEGKTIESGVRNFRTAANSRIENVADFLVRRSCLPMIFGIFRTEVFHSALPFVSLGAMTGDVDNVFMLKVLVRTRVDSIPKQLFSYRLKDRTNVAPPDMPRYGLGRWWYLAQHNARVTQHFTRTIAASDLPVLLRGALRAMAWAAYAMLCLVDWTWRPLYLRWREKRGLSGR